MDCGCGPFTAYCDMRGNWTVFQRRFNGVVEFYRNWNSYGTCCKLVPDFRDLPRTGANKSCSLPHGDLLVTIYVRRLQIVVML